MLLKFVLLLAFVAAVSEGIIDRRIENRLQRPCKLGDYDCIGGYLKGISKCSDRVVESFPERFLVQDYRFEVPSLNSTFIQNEMILINLDSCGISEFAVNTRGDSIVYSVDCPNFGFNADTTIIHHRSGQEDRYYYILDTGTYPLIRLTVNLKRANKFDLCSTFVFTDVIGAGRIQIKPRDPETADFLNRKTIAFGTNIETFLFSGNAMFRLFNNFMVCDYGCGFTGPNRC